MVVFSGVGELARQMRAEKNYHYAHGDEVPDDLQKYWFQRHNIFSKYDEGIQLTDKSWFGITPEPIAHTIAHHVAQASPASKTVLIDAFAGAGGNAIAFALSGRWEQIFAIENDPEELKCAKKNAEIYGVHKEIYFIEGDCFDVIKKRLSKMGKSAVLFASPPWGGPEYKASAVFDLSLMQPYSLIDLHDGFAKWFPDLVLYLPRTSNLNQIAERVKGRKQMQVVHYCINGYSKALCAYYGEFSTI